MRKVWLLALLLLCALPAQADDNLRVTLALPSGSDLITFTLKDQDVTTFWTRWRRLERSDSMVPLGDGTGYSGVVVRDEEQMKEIRLYKGVGRMDEEGRTDDFRILERWLLTKAPPPLGPALLAALDEEVAVRAAATNRIAPPKPPSSQQTILSCRTRARHNDELRIRCLQDALAQNADAHAYAGALESLATALLPSAPNQPPMTR